MSDKEQLSGLDKGSVKDHQNANYGDKKKKRFQGYELEGKHRKSKKRNRPWFWRVYGMSFLLSIIIMVIICACLFGYQKKKTDYLSGINNSNTMSAILKDHSNVQIECTYSHLAEGSDYKTLRQVKKNKKGQYYSYFKTEGTDADYKEVIKNGELYRSDDKFVQYFGLVDSDYEDSCVSDIENSVFQTAGTESIDTQKENGDVIKIQTTYEVKDGDIYTTKYGFAVGEKINKSFTLDKATNIVMAEQESCGDDVFYSYTVTFDVDEIVPKFYKELSKTKETRTCTVIYNYQNNAEQEYTFSVPLDVYFTLLDHDNYKVYMDDTCSKEFTEYQMEIENPENEMTLYMVKSTNE